jgi:predicted CXXCH cytochrome family protein
MRANTWRAVVVFLAIVSLVSVMATTVFATGGPHQGTFTATTDACAGCHRAHTGTAAKLLKSTTQYALCTSCHDGTSADTKVTTGVYLGTSQGVQNAGLRGGGFEQAYMDTSASGNVTSGNITSKHTVGASAATAWGSGTTGNGETVALECGNCHNPHGNSNYRILRPKPTSLSGWSSLTAVNITAGLSDNYTITYDANNYRDLSAYSANVTNKMAEWCGQCHTRYKASPGSGSTDSGSSPFNYRHHTDTLSGECLACHVAHGTSASMSGNAAGPTWPDGSANATWQTGTEGQYSRLLTVDNRGVCLQCHSSSDLSQN